MSNTKLPIGAQVGALAALPLVLGMTIGVGPVGSGLWAFDAWLSGLGYMVCFAVFALAVIAGLALLMGPPLFCLWWLLGWVTGAHERERKFREDAAQNDAYWKARKAAEAEAAAQIEPTPEA